MLVHAVEPAQRFVDRTRFVQRALGEEAVHPHPKAREALPHALEHQRDSLLGDLLRVGLGGAVDPVGQLAHIRAAVLLGLLAPGAGANGLAELAHLGAGVVDVELTLHLVARPLQRARQRIPVGGMASGGHGHGAGGVGRHELHLNARSRVAGAEALSRRAHRRQRLEVPAIGHEEIQKARAGDLDLVHRGAEPLPQDVAEALGDRPRRLAERGRQQHRRVGGVVAEVRAWRAIELRRGHRARCPPARRPSR